MMDISSYLLVCLSFHDTNIGNDFISLVHKDTIGGSFARSRREGKCKGLKVDYLKLIKLGSTYLPFQVRLKNMNLHRE